MGSKTLYFEFLFLFPFLYAETHYRFKYFLSWLKKPEPEIIADIPSRITRGDLLPVLLVIKDADKYPAEILSVTIKENNTILFNNDTKLSVNQSFFEHIYYLETQNLNEGKLHLNIAINYKINNKIKTCYNDNHRGTSHHPLPVYIGSETFPQIDNCVYGEMHSHTNYTSDQVEFGASIGSSAILAKAMGLSFFCATDHSYDLDDQIDNYLINDPNLKKWKSLKEEIKSFNIENNDFCIIAGEEASLTNNLNKNVHCLIYNSEKFYPGAGDSGEKWLHPYSELSINDVLDDVDDETLVFAAHPVEPVPFLQQRLIRRDNWHETDCKHPRLNGLQFANGGPDIFFKKGKELWIKLLLHGHKLIGLAGNDAHGNFSRYRQISTPFITVSENYYHLFGKWRTGVFLESDTIETNSILQSIKKGNCFLTNGPALQFNALSNGSKVSMGCSCSNIEQLRISVNSSSEFGEIGKIKIVYGSFSDKKEKILFQKMLDNKNLNYNLEYELKEKFGSGYFRCEVTTTLNNIAVSNPIWIE